jgi:hypothetical protein
MNVLRRLHQICHVRDNVVREQTPHRRKPK